MSVNFPGRFFSFVTHQAGEVEVLTTLVARHNIKGDSDVFHSADQFQHVRPLATVVLG